MELKVWCPELRWEISKNCFSLAELFLFSISTRVVTTSLHVAWIECFEWFRDLVWREIYLMFPIVQHMVKLFRTLFLLFGQILNPGCTCFMLYCCCTPQLQLWPEPFAAVQPDIAAEALWPMVITSVLGWGRGADTEQAGQLRHLWRRGFAYARWAESIIQSIAHSYPWS